MENGGKKQALHGGSSTAFSFHGKWIPGLTPTFWADKGIE